MEIVKLLLKGTVSVLKAYAGMYAVLAPTGVFAGYNFHNPNNLSFVQFFNVFVFEEKFLLQLFLLLGGIWLLLWVFVILVRVILVLKFKNKNSIRFSDIPCMDEDTLRKLWL